MTTIFGSNVTKLPVILCGRPVWVSEEGGYGSTLKRVWVHTNPHQPADLYFSGTSLTDGTQADNLAYLEELCRGYISTLPPISDAMRAIWEADAASRAKPEWLLDLEVTAASAAAMVARQEGRRYVTYADVDNYIRAEKLRRGYSGPHNVYLD